ncbi:hypothetical protein [Paucibacter sp. KCTC 42545]|uniref:hypothetical protein n=1 Tax=Paucibacter sp. KCTC 42545 TaxID=1768242 RepID=UPI000733A866|nr:hypothetical protein [Paucibacter sp. KCTC 42545]ALT78701.1 hypothetical protein AT984_17390 [Paucibacter sp. KCTC 42545]
MATSIHQAHALHYRPVLLAAWQQHRNGRSRYFVPLVVGLSALLLLAIGLTASWSAALQTAAALASAGLLGLWTALFANLCRQNHPHHARLLPLQLQSLRATLALSQLMLSAAIALLMGLSQGHALAWGLGAGLLMLVIAACVRWWQMSVLVWLGFMVLVEHLQSPWVQAPWQALLAWYTLQPATLALAAALLLPWCTSRLLQAGGSRHAANYQRRARARQMFREQMTGAKYTPKHFSPVGLWLWELFTWPVPLWTRHLLRQARPTAKSAIARAELVTLGNVHWVAMLGSASLVLSIAVVVILAMQIWLEPFDWQHVHQGGNLGLQIGLVSMAMNPLFGLAANLYRTRREQALLMLLPGMPRGRALNTLMARRTAIQFLAQWLIALCALVLVAGGNEALAGMNFSGLHLLLACLPAGSLLLRDWSSLPSPGQGPAILVFIGVVAFALAMAGLQWLGLSMWLMAAAAVLLSLALLRWRWQGLILKSPAAMPVGRWG